MICPRCGTSNAPESASCMQCGQSLGDGGVTQTQDPTFNRLKDQSSIETASIHPSKNASQGSLPSTLLEGQEIGHRYRVMRSIGEGGMGVVYLVHDLELDRDIALKLIRVPLVEDPQLLERFKREIQLSSEITHQNVLRVYDLGESEGTRFLTMQYVPGEDLASIIRREGKLPLEKIILIFRQICEGLAAAHDKGVLHRDLKPQNIMVDEETHAYVMDFGLAKAVDRSGITRTGEFMGSPAYMSPEQVKGETLDLRSDIYSLGMILYEMITGRRPYEEGSAYEIMMRRLKTPPTPAGEIRTDIPAYLLRILDRCIEINKSMRYGSLKQIIHDLDKARVRTTLTYKIRHRRILKPVLLGLIAILIAGSGIYLYQYAERSGLQSETAPAAVAQVPVVAVLPFENRTGDPSLDWYGEGIPQLIADNLAQSRHIQVVSSSRIQILRAANNDPAALSKAMADGGIDYSVTGEILPGASGMTLAARVSGTREGRDVASRRQDSLSKEGVIQAADQMALTVRRGLNIPTTENVDTFTADYASRSPEAYEAYVAGLRAFADYDYTEAEQAFRKALEEAPDYTMARYRLSQVLMVTGRQEEAIQGIHQAMAESSRLPDLERRYIRATEAYISRRFEDAIKDYREIIADYPYEIEARQRLAVVLMDNGQFKETIALAKINAQMEPEISTHYSMLGAAYLKDRNVSEAVTAFRRFAELKPESTNAHNYLGSAYLAQGEFDLAAEEYNRAVAIDPGNVYAQIDLGILDVLRGRYNDAEKRFNKIIGSDQAIPRLRIEAAFDLAYVLRAQGRFRESIKPLETLQKEIEKESIREALALSVRGLSLMEIGKVQEASRLIEQAIVKAPVPKEVPPTVYLYSRGLLELKQGKSEAALKTASSILQSAYSSTSGVFPSDERVSSYLKGMAFLIDGKLGDAIAELSQTVTFEGIENATCRLGLARAYLAARRLPEALAAAKQAAGALDLFEPSLSRELDRVRAILVQAEVQLEMGRNSEAAALAKQFLNIWNRADTDISDRFLAEQIIQRSSKTPTTNTQ